MQRRSFNLMAAATAVALGTFAVPALAAWPDRPINIIVPYAPGGTADALARLIGQQLSIKLNTPVVIQNKAGASGMIGADAVAKAAADGYTVLYDATPFSINPHLQKMPFDPQKDLAPLTLVGVTPMLLVVPKNSPFNSVKDLVAAAKKAPGKLTYSSGGQGTVQYMAGELFSQGAGLKTLHVSYKSGGPGLQAIMAGEVDFGFGNIPAVGGQVKGGTMKALAVTANQRSTLFPDVPTVAESAVKGYEAYEWNGMFVPAGTPADIVGKLNAAIKDVLATPELKARFDSLGSRIVASSPDEFGKHLAAETKRWGGIIKASGIRKE